MRLFNHESRYNLIWLKKRAQIVEDVTLATQPENLEEGESTPGDVHFDCELAQ